MLKSTRLLLVTIALALAPFGAYAAATALQWGVDRTTAPWTTCVYDANNVCQGVFTVPSTGGGALLPASRGGTGVNNGSSTITLGGSLSTSGAFALAFTLTGGTSLTLPTSGTLATLGGANTWTGANNFTGGLQIGGVAVRTPNASSPLFYVNGDSVNPQTCGLTGALTCQPGADTNNGLSNSAPFLTVAHAVSTILNSYDGLGVEIAVNLAHGTSANYGGWACASHVVGGFVDIRIVGDRNAPTAVGIVSPNGGAGAYLKDQCVVIFDSVNFTDAGSALEALYVSQGGIADVKNVHFAAFNSSAAHILIDKSGQVNAITPTIDGGAGEFVQVRGGLFSVAQTNVPAVASTIAIPNAVAFTTFIDAAGPSMLANFNSGTFTGAGVAGTTGKRAALDGPVYFQGGGTSINTVLPGNSAATLIRGAATDAGDAQTTPLAVASGGIGAAAAGATAVGNISGATPVSCPSGVTAATVVVLNGIVTHC